MRVVWTTYLDCAAPQKQARPTGPAEAKLCGGVSARERTDTPVVGLERSEIGICSSTRGKISQQTVSTLKRNTLSDHRSGVIYPHKVCLPSHQLLGNRFQRERGNTPVLGR